MNCLLFLFAMLVGVAWGQTALRPALDPAVALQPVCESAEAGKASLDLAEALDNPQDLQYQISKAESQKLLTALEAEGIGRNEGLLQARNAEFAAPNVTLRASIKRPCPSSNNYCPHSWRRLVTVRHNGPCGMEYCRPLPWYSSYYAVCSCRSCYRGRGRCLPSNFRSRVLLAFCYHRALGWNIRAVRVTLPSRCQCRRFCRG